MSEDKEVATEAKALPMPFPVMETDISVSMDDVVSAFVATYENNLFARKKALSKEVKAKEAELKALDKKVLAELPGTEYEGEVQPFDLIAEIDTTTINWGEELDDNKVFYSITVKPTGTERHNYSNKINIRREKEIPAGHVGAHDALNDALKPLRGELAEVLDNIKSITRKERQVRGRIAIRKLEDSGYASLMADPELKKLVELD